MKRHLQLCLLLCACDGTSPTTADPLDTVLPALPPTGGAQAAFAGRITVDNFAQERIPGEGIPGGQPQARPGDFFLRNDKVRFVVRAPGRAIGPCPYGGIIIDADTVDAPAGDQLGAVAPFLQLGRTVDFQKAEIVRDGSQGGAAVLRFRGVDVLDDYVNVTGLGGLTQAIGDDYRAQRKLGLQVAATYILAPGSTAAEVIFTFYNPTPDEVDTLHGTITDSGAEVEIFHPGIGFGDFGIADLLGSTAIPLVDYFALQGQGIAYGVAPRYADPATRGFPFPIVGVDVEVYDVKQKGDILGPHGQSLRVPGHAGASYTVDVMVDRDVAGVEAQVRARAGVALGAIAGSVESPDTNTPQARARVIVEDPAGRLVTAFVSDGKGAFSGRLPPGTWQLTAEGDSYLRGAPTMITVPATGTMTPVVLSIPEAALVEYRVHDDKGVFMPAKIDVVGTQASPPDKRFRDVSKDPYPTGIAGWLASLGGDSSLGTRWDHPLRLKPGHYRVVVGRGPEFGRHEEVVDLVAGRNPTVDATLLRVLDTGHYLASDFHQHTYWSPDAPVPPADRVVGYLAEGLEFASTTEHDVHFDMQPTVKALGAVGLLDTCVGVEVTPFDYGHFMGYPVTVDPMSPTGGAFDWGHSPTTGLDRSPREIFDGLRAVGAEVVQVNHPRDPPGTSVLNQFQRNFDRAGLTFDFAGHSFGGSNQLAQVKAVELGLPDGAELFSPTFNALEVYNGVTYGHVVADSEGGRSDTMTWNALRDWMDFLSFGFITTAVANSDSHEWVRQPPGLPRTMVAVPDDSSGALAMGESVDVMRTLTGAMPRDVVGTNTPMLTVAVDGAGMGRTVTHSDLGKPLAITVRVQTPTWAPVDTVEIYANATFDVPPQKGKDATPFAPVLCFTTRGAPTQRCSHAVGGARLLTWQTVPVGSGQARLEAKLSADLDVAAALATVREGARGQDLWLVAIATGDTGLFPTVPQGLVEADVAAFVEGGVATLAGKGVPSLAFTNPVFVDVDGGGWKAPFAP